MKLAKKEGIFSSFPLGVPFAPVMAVMFYFSLCLYLLLLTPAYGFLGFVRGRFIQPQTFSSPLSDALLASDQVSETSPPPPPPSDLIPSLIAKKHCLYPSLVPYDTLLSCSHLASSTFASEGGHAGTYLGKPWKNSRIYIDAGRVWNPSESSVMSPIISAVRSSLIAALGLPDSPSTLPVESAFVNYYVGSGSQPRSMSSHVDCDWRGSPVPLSVVVQGVYDNGGGEDTLGRLFVGEGDGQVSVDMKAGDGLVLAEGVHRPYAVSEGERRLVFVIFFSAIEQATEEA